MVKKWSLQFYISNYKSALQSFNKLNNVYINTLCHFIFL